MEAAAPSAKPGRQPPPIPPNYVSLRHLQELRLKEKEEQERRRREEEEAAAAAKREAEAARAAAIKREAVLRAEAKGRAASWEASGGAKEWHREGKAAQGQGNQWVAVAHRAPAMPPGLMARGQGAAGKKEAAIGGGHGEKGADDVPDNAPRGGGKPWKGKGKWKGREKEKRAEAASAPSHGGKPAAVVPASPYGGKPESKGESKAKGKPPGNQAAESGSSGGGPGEQAEARILSSRDRFRRGRRRDSAGRNAETCKGVAPVKTAGPSPPRGVQSDGVGKPKPPGPRRADEAGGDSPDGKKTDGMGKPKPPGPRRADAVAGGESPDGKKTAPAQAPPHSAADGDSKSTSRGELCKTTEAKPGGLVEGQRRRQVVEAQLVAELNPRAARCSAWGPWRGRGNDAAEQHGRVWVPKPAAAAGSSAGSGL